MNMHANQAAEDGEAAPIPDDLVGVRECAEKLGNVHASTISRQLAKGLFQNYGSESAPRLSLSQVRTAREQSLNPALQRKPPANTQAGAPETGYAAERAAREKINRQRDEIALGEKMGTILDRAQVEDDFETFGRALRGRMRQRAANLILELEQLTTTQAREARLVEADEALLAEMADEMESLADAGGGGTH